MHLGRSSLRTPARPVRMPATKKRASDKDGQGCFGYGARGGGGVRPYLSVTCKGGTLRLQSWYIASTLCLLKVEQEEVCGEFG